MTEPTALISVVIASKNRPDSLDRLLRSLAQQDYRPYEIVVVDDGSQPPLQLESAEFKYLRNPESMGMCSARNRGIGEARGELIALFDDDVELLDSRLLSRAVELTRQVPDCGAIGFRQLRASGSAYEMQPTAASVPCYVGNFFGYGNLLSMAALKKVGLFEPLFGFYYEEMDLSLRLLDANYSIIYDPALCVIHHRDERGRDQTRIYRLMLRNTILTGLLHCPWWTVPAVTAAALVRHVRWTKRAGALDLAGIGWSAAEVVRAAGYVRKNRRPVRFAALRKKRRLARHPQPIHGC